MPDTEVGSPQPDRSSEGGCGVVLDGSRDGRVDGLALLGIKYYTTIRYATFGLNKFTG